MFDVNRLREVQKIASDPTESEHVRALCTILSTLEHRQLEAVEDLHAALGIDGISVESTQEERETQLLELVDALANGDFRSWWFSEVVGEHIENPEDAVPYAGLTSNEWESQKGMWADSWRERGGEEFAQHSDIDLARLHVERRFGVSLREFEREVVNWDRKEAMQSVLAGNFEAVEAGIRAAAVEAREQREQDQDTEGSV